HAAFAQGADRGAARRHARDAVANLAGTARRGPHRDARLRGVLAKRVEAARELGLTNGAPSSSAPAPAATHYASASFPARAGAAAGSSSSGTSPGVSRSAN